MKEKFDKTTIKTFLLRSVVALRDVEALKVAELDAGMQITEKTTFGQVE